MSRVVAQRYKLGERLGSGGMAEVWSAFDLKLQRRVALKRVLQDQFERPGSLERFEREATAIARLSSPQIVEIHDYGLDEGVPYIIMELLEGEDLAQRLQRLGQLRPSHVRTLVTQTCSALIAAHVAGLVHRDLKPANLFISGRENLKVLDFGVVSILESERQEIDDITHNGVMIGTPRYMSPEQIRGTQVDHRSDLWSLAVVCYQALLGALPFEGRTAGDLVLHICVEGFLPPSQVGGPELAGLDAFFARALAKDPEHRFQSANEFDAAFGQACSASKARPLKVLFVDDEPDLPFMIEQAFYSHVRDSIYELLFARNGQEALDCLREHQDIELVVTDINMPVMDGLSLLAQLGEVAPHARAIIVSAYGDMKNIRTAMNRGAFDFLFKPLDFEDLDATIAKASAHLSLVRESSRVTQENHYLRHFVSPFVLDKLAGGDAPLDVEGEYAATVLAFGFGGPSPNVEVRLINANLEVLFPIIANHGGVIDKFVGKVVVALFRGEGHLRRALAACTYARRQLLSLVKRWGHRSPFAHGMTVGVTSGVVEWNTIGARAFGRVDFSCCGEVVREAMHLEARATLGEILVSPAVRFDADEGQVFRPATGDGEPHFVLSDPELEAKAELAFDNTESLLEQTLQDSGSSA